MHCVSLSLYRFPSLAGRLWVLGQMGAARFALPRTPAAAGMPDASALRLAGLGHLAHEEAPEAVARHIRAFAAEVLGERDGPPKEEGRRSPGGP